MLEILEKIKSFFTPPLWLLLILALLVDPLLILTFVYLDKTSFIAVFVYMLAVYTILAMICSFRSIVDWVKTSVAQDRKGKIYPDERMSFKEFFIRLFRDPYYRSRISLNFGLIINFGFVIFKLSSGIRYHSVWLIAVGVYYLLLGFIRFLLLRDAQTSSDLDTDEQILHECRAYLRSGWMLLVLDMIIFGMAVDMVVENMMYPYTGAFVVFSAIFTFYYLVIAITSMVLFRRRGNLLWSAAKSMTLVSALMAAFVFQPAALAVFFDVSGTLHRLLNAASGAIVFGVVFFIAFRMISKGRRYVKVYSKKVKKSS